VNRMNAVLLKGHGGFEQLEFRDDVEVPAPRVAEVLVQVGASSINNTDINTRTGWYSRTATVLAEAPGWTGAPPAFPRIQGADACGRIVAVGSGVDAARVGERVLIEPVFRVAGASDQYRAVYFGSECDGAFAQFTCVPAAHAYAARYPTPNLPLFPAPMRPLRTC
jgi:NADPH:quinone reductase-like Zn-dependent oxidoreductase